MWVFALLWGMTEKKLGWAGRNDEAHLLHAECDLAPLEA
jgi:hypothetical protein